jgi:hypothetical protein
MLQNTVYEHKNKLKEYKNKIIALKTKINELYREISYLKYSNSTNVYESLQNTPNIRFQGNVNVNRKL